MQRNHVTGPQTPQAKRLVRLREYLGYPEQQLFAREFNYGQSRYNHYETGRRRMPVWVVDRICTRFPIPGLWLWLMRGDPSQLDETVFLRLEGGPSRSGNFNTLPSERSKSGWRASAI